MPFPKSLRDLHGKPARTRRDLSNGLLTIPAGTLVTVTAGARWNKLSIRGKACPGCGVTPRMGGVNILDLAPVE